jgi:hypothetical protein
MQRKISMWIIIIIIIIIIIKYLGIFVTIFSELYLSRCIKNYSLYHRDTLKIECSYVSRFSVSKIAKSLQVWNLVSITMTRNLSFYNFMQF